MQRDPTRRDLLDLLKKLARIQELESFCLVGGTALSFLLEHRESQDIDLFSAKKFSSEKIIAVLEQLGEIADIEIGDAVARFTLNGISIDLVTFPYPELEEPFLYDGIKVLKLPDLAAMKLNAVSRRGKKRDFFDIFFLLEKYSLKELLSFFIKRFPKANIVHILKSLAYFEDAERDPEPKLIKSISWLAVKEKIISEVGMLDLSDYA